MCSARRRSAASQRLPCSPTRDADAPFVHEADEAVRIGEGPVGASYLSIDKIIDAAKQTGADAIHPGYGLLSERAAFAQACTDAGITFVGPSAAAIETMGDKVLAKRAMIAAGVPVVPGYQGNKLPTGEGKDVPSREGTDAALIEAAGRMGVPLLVKAAAGGGGRGMRAVHSLDALPQALQSARSEAQAAFGDGSLFLEKLIEGGRHIEVQIMADRHGNVSHLFERECSVQRRHQKVIEEAPSPAVDDALRERICAAAVTAAQAIDYVGAGTVEFLLDDAGNFYFLEMNTRLQVEHPVTEKVTNLDLVDLQLRAAQGDVLTDLTPIGRPTGHAIEVRIYAEDPYAGFLPQTGTIVHWEEPRGVRVDSGVTAGQVITPLYDPMIAKVIAWGSSREEARRRLARGLRATLCFGPLDNRGWLLELLHDPVFASGEFRTDTLDNRPTPPRPEPAASHWALAAWLACQRSAAQFGERAWFSTRGTATAVVDLRHADEQRTIAIAVDRAGGRDRDGRRRHRLPGRRRARGAPATRADQRHPAHGGRDGDRAGPHRHRGRRASLSLCRALCDDGRGTDRRGRRCADADRRPGRAGARQRRRDREPGR